jgi:hypothetical protein
VERWFFLLGFFPCCSCIASCISTSTLARLTPVRSYTLARALDGSRCGFGLLVYGKVRLQLVYSLGTKFFLTRRFQFLFNDLVRPPRFLRSFAGATSAPVASVLGEAEEAGAPLLSGDVLDEPAHSAADLGTGGHDVEPPEVQGTPRSLTRR